MQVPFDIVGVADNFIAHFIEADALVVVEIAFFLALPDSLLKLFVLGAFFLLGFQTLNLIFKLVYFHLIARNEALLLQVLRRVVVQDELFHHALMRDALRLSLLQFELQFLNCLVSGLQLPNLA